MSANYCDKHKCVKKLLLSSFYCEQCDGEEGTSEPTLLGKNARMLINDEVLIGSDVSPNPHISELARKQIDEAMNKCWENLLKGLFKSA